MPDVFILSCPCKWHDFVFNIKPTRKVEVKCPECGEVLVYDPDGQEKINKEDKDDVSKTKQK